MASYAKTLEKAKEHLRGGEVIAFSVFGAYEKNGITKNGVLIATADKILFFGLKIFGFDLETIPFKRITSIEQTRQMMGDVITINTAGGPVTMKWINAGDVTGFVDFVSDQI